MQRPQWPWGERTDVAQVDAAVDERLRAAPVLAEDRDIDSALDEPWRELLDKRLEAAVAGWKAAGTEDR